jgi:hypothetical protein
MTAGLKEDSPEFIIEDDRLEATDSMDHIEVDPAYKQVDSNITEADGASTSR